MSNIIVHALAMIGVVTLLLFLCRFLTLLVLTIKRKNPNDWWSIVRTQMVSDNEEGMWYFIPTIRVSKTKFKTGGNVIEISARFLKWEFYTSYNLSNEV